MSCSVSIFQDFLSGEGTYILLKRYTFHETHTALLIKPTFCKMQIDLTTDETLLVLFPSSNGVDVVVVRRECWQIEQQSVQSWEKMREEDFSKKFRGYCETSLLKWASCSLVCNEKIWDRKDTEHKQDTEMKLNTEEKQDIEKKQPSHRRQSKVWGRFRISTKKQCKGKLQKSRAWKKYDAEKRQNAEKIHPRRRRVVFGLVYREALV